MKNMFHPFLFCLLFSFQLGLCRGQIVDFQYGGQKLAFAVDTNLLFHSWYKPGVGGISFELEGVSMYNPVNNLHATYPCYLKDRDSIYIDFDGDFFRGCYRVTGDSLHLRGKLQDSLYSWNLKYDKRESFFLRKNAWKYIPRDTSLSQRVKGIWIRLGSGEDYTSADLAISDTTVLLVDIISEDYKMIELPYHLKDQILYWKVGEKYYKGKVKIDNGILSIHVILNGEKPPIDLSGDYELFPEFEKRMRIKRKAKSK